MPSRNFKYLICIDFEATCWEGNYPPRENAEIIEIGAVLLHVDSGKVRKEFHRYVRPVLYPELSKFCMNLTGISQEKVDRQKTFVDVFDHFQDWIEQIQYEFDLRFATQSRNLSTKYGPNVTFCSWSNYDLQFFLKKECQRNDIRIPPHLKAWINVQRIYDEKYLTRNCSFTDALKHTNIKKVGSSHCAHYDAINLKTIVVYLIRNGVRFDKSGYIQSLPRKKTKKMPAQLAQDQVANESTSKNTETSQRVNNPPECLDYITVLTSKEVVDRISALEEVNKTLHQTANEFKRKLLYLENRINSLEQRLAGIRIGDAQKPAHHDDFTRCEEK